MPALPLDARLRGLDDEDEALEHEELRLRPELDVERW